jgi:molybdopterin-guanine dinucleotide biosynthesis protein A
MGGVDKGLQMLEGETLVQHTLRRLEPQVGPLMISANRNLEVYTALGVPVWSDVDADFRGPLAGFLAGLAHCETPWLATVPCDTPRFPMDLVERLRACIGDAGAAVAVTRAAGRIQRQSGFCLLRRSVAPDLRSFLDGGGRKIERWLERQGCVDVRFDDAEAFFNANTIKDLRSLSGTST